MISRDKFNSLIEEAGSIGISGHLHPDGDCAGSTLGLYNYIKTYYKDTNVSIFLEPIPPVFNFLKGSDEIRDAESFDGDPFDLFFALDCSDLHRLRHAGRLFNEAKISVCLDHHINPDGFGDYFHILSEESSTSELVCDLIGKDKMTKDIAECLYTGMVHDTGVFQYQSTSSKTMNNAGMLMDMGIDYSKIIDETYFKKTFVQNKLLGRALSKAEVFHDRIIASVITKDDFKELNATPGDTEGIVAQLRYTMDTDVAILMYQNEDRSFKVSLRTSKEINLQKVAAFFGGGGHAKASGCTVGQDYKTELPRIIEKIREFM